MTIVSYAVEVEAPAERVWEVVSDPRNLPHWDRHIVAVEGVPDDGLRAGVRYTTLMRLVAFHAWVRVEVLTWEPPHEATFHLSGVLDATIRTTVEPLADERSRLRQVVEYRFRGGPFGDLAAKSLALVGGARYALRHGVLAQKREIEVRAP